MFLLRLASISLAKARCPAGKNEFKFFKHLNFNLRMNFLDTPDAFTYIYHLEQLNFKPVYPGYLNDSIR